MQPETIPCNYNEAVKYVTKLKQDERDATKELTAMRNSINKLNSLIYKNSNENYKGIIQLPVELLWRRGAQNGKAKTINWKKLVIEMINKYKMPMTSRLLYCKFLLQHEEVPLDRKFVTKNISAALYYLVEDDKLFRIKLGNKRDYIYGLKHHFTDDPKIKPEYFKKYLAEIGTCEQQVD